MFVYFEIEMTNSRTGLVILWLFLSLRPKSLFVRSIMALAHLMSCEFPGPQTLFLPSLLIAQSTGLAANDRYSLTSTMILCSPCFEFLQVECISHLHPESFVLMVQELNVSGMKHYLTLTCPSHWNWLARKKERWGLLVARTCLLQLSTFYQNSPRMLQDGEVIHHIYLKLNLPIFYGIGYYFY